MTVVVPAGLPILDAARWVGESCWLELHAHQVLTDVLASDEVDDELRVALWRIRSNRAEVAEAWHRRLPELREFPRDSFVLAPADVADDAEPRDDVTIEALLSALDGRYADHVAVAVGPADGPVAETLRRARGLLAQDRASIAGRPEGSVG